MFCLLIWLITSHHALQNLTPLQKVSECNGMHSKVNLLIHLTEAVDINYFRARFHTGRHRRVYCSPAQLCWRQPRESLNRLCKTSTACSEGKPLH